jgi:hypothetical protein
VNHCLAASEQAFEHFNPVFGVPIHIEELFIFSSFMMRQ